MANVVSIVIKAVDETAKGFTTPLTNLKALEKAASSMATVVVGAGTAVAASLIGLTEHSINAAEEIGKMAERTGMAVEPLSRLLHAADLAHVSTEQFEVGIKNLNKTLAEAAGNSTSAAADAFRAVGVSLVDTSGKVKSNQQVFLELSDRFSSFEDGANKSALALKFFGKSGVDMLPMLNQGASGIRDIGNEIDGVTDAEAKQAAEFKDNLTRMKSAMADIGNVIAKAVLPYLVEFSAWTVKAQKDSGFFAAVALTVVDVLKGFAVALHGVYTLLEVVGTIVGAVAAAIAMEFSSSVRMAIDLGKAWFDGLKAIGEALLHTGKVAGEVGEALMKLATGHFKEAWEIGKQSAADFGAEIGQVGQTISETVTKSGQIIADKYKQDFEDAKAIAKNAAASIADDFSKLGTFSLDIFTPKVAAPDQAPLDRQKIPAPLVEQGKDNTDEFEKKHAESLIRVGDLERQYIVDSLEGYAKQRAQIDDDYQHRMEQIAKLNLVEGEGDAAMLASHKAYVAAKRQLDLQAVQVYGNTLGSLATLAQTFGKKGFIAAKAFSYGQAVINVAEGATKALAQGGFLGIAMMAAVLAAGAAQIATISATNVGAAHGGLDYVPAETTYLLDRGERVVSPKQNEDLTDFLAGRSGSGSGQTAIHVDVDGHTLFTLIGEASRDGRLSIAARSVR